MSRIFSLKFTKCIKLFLTKIYKVILGDNCLYLHTHTHTQTHTHKLHTLRNNLDAPQSCEDVLEWDQTNLTHTAGMFPLYLQFTDTISTQCIQTLTQIQVLTNTLKLHVNQHMYENTWRTIFLTWMPMSQWLNKYPYSERGRQRKGEKGQGEEENTQLWADVLICSKHQNSCHTIFRPIPALVIHFFELPVVDPGLLKYDHLVTWNLWSLTLCSPFLSISSFSFLPSVLCLHLFCVLDAFLSHNFLQPVPSSEVWR